MRFRYCQPLTNSPSPARGAQLSYGSTTSARRSGGSRSHAVRGSGNERMKRTRCSAGDHGKAE